MPANVNTVIQFLRDSDLSEADLVADPELNGLIEARMRLTGPLPLRCDKPRCNSIIVYWALSSDDARVFFGPDRRHHSETVKGIYQVEHDPYAPAILPQPAERVVGGAVDLLFADLDHEGRFDAHVEWAMLEHTNAELLTDPSVKAPLVLRFGFTCPRCGATSQYTNSTMLRLYLRALTLGKREIRPSRI